MFSLHNVFTGSEGVRMAFSPNEGKQNGGGLLVLAFSDDSPLRPDAEYFVAFEGVLWRHLVTAKRVDNVTFHSYIPEHRESGNVRLSIMMARETNIKALATSSFRYIPEAVEAFAEFLLNSVCEPSALDNADQIKAENREVFEEDLSVVDRKICKHLSRSKLPKDWHILGPKRVKAPPPRETLLHFCARLGLRWTARYLVGLPGGQQALNLPNIQDDTPTDVSNMYGNIDLADMFSGRPVSWKGDPPWLDTDSLEKGAPPTKIKRVDKELYVLTTNMKLANTSLYDDLAMMKEVVDSRRPPKQAPPLRTSPRSMSAIETSTRPVRKTSHNTSGPRSRSKSDGVLHESMSENSDENEDAFRAGAVTHPPSKHQHHGAAPPAVSSRHQSFQHAHYHPPHKKPLHTSHSYSAIHNSFDSSVAMDTNTHYVPAPDNNNAAVAAPPPPVYRPAIHAKPFIPPKLGKPDVSSNNTNAPKIPWSGTEWNKPVLVESIKKLQEIHTSLQQKLQPAPGTRSPEAGEQARDQQPEDSRKENLNRFSLSCPSLPDSLTLAPSPDPDDVGNNELADHHGSLSSLSHSASSSPRTAAQAAMPDGIHLQDYIIAKNNPVNTLDNIVANDRAVKTMNNLGYGEVSSSPRPPQHSPSVQHHEVKIIINDVTVDTSAEDYNVPVTTSSSSCTTDGPVSGDSTDLIEQIKRANKRRSSWCPEEGRKKEEKHEKQRMLNVTGRSQSLSSLDGDSDEEEDGEDEDVNSVSSSSTYYETSADPADLSPGRYGNNTSASQADSPPGRYGQTPAHKRDSPPSRYAQALIEDRPRPVHYPQISSTPVSKSSDVLLTSLASPALLERSASPSRGSPGDDLSRSNTTPGLADSSGMVARHAVTSMSPTSSHSTGVQHSSGPVSPVDPTTPSDDGQGLILPGNTLAKASSSPSIATAGHQDDKANAQPTDFVESPRMTVHGPEDDSRDEMDGRDECYRGQSTATSPDTADFSSPVTPEETEDRPKSEKKRKTGVFAKIGSMRQKKVITKDTKLLQNAHQFVSVSVSNATLCNVCGKSMANKASLQCENCLVNVHENYCKDQIYACKYRVTRNNNGDKSASLPGQYACTVPETASLNANLKQSQSFKEKRSISVPARPVIQTSNSAGVLPRSSSPSRVINEERDKAKEDECQMQFLDTTNITDTLSVSLESLEEVTDIDEDFEQEPEAWSVTVDKKTLKKMSAKDIKRQDHIWELIQTERSHNRTLKIMHTIFSRGIRTEVGLSQEMIDRIFPRLADLLDIHTTFLCRLRERQRLRPDRSIEEVGDLLINQFYGEMGQKMKEAYGEFCSGHNLAVQFYKDLYKTDRKFQAFIKKCSRSTICKRLGIPECILLVTQRVTKYPLLLEPIIKTTKDHNKADKEKLTQALSLVKEVLVYIDSQVDAHEKHQRLLDIYNKLDARSYVMYKGEKFKKSNILGRRKLIHEGYMKWMTARGKPFEVLAVILTDVMFFLAENNQRFTFFSQDSKSSVVPLSKLLVREKGDTRDSKGIYLICQSKTEPEMYEFVCRSAQEGKAWIKIIKNAVMTCMEVEGATTIQKDTELEGDRKELEAKSARIRQLLEQVYQKDYAVKQACDEKMTLITEMLEVFHKEELSRHIQSLYKEDESPDTVDMSVLNTLKSVLEEGSKVLSSVLPGGASVSVGRSTTSVGEKGRDFTPSLPKRAETFSGFDQKDKVKKRFNSGQLSETESGSDGQLSNADSDHVVMSKEAPAATEHKEEKSRTPSGFLQSLIKSHTERDSDTDSSKTHSDTGNDTLQNNMAAGVLTAPSRDQCESLAQLMQHLHSLVCITGHQVTEIEKFRAQLSEANSKVSTLYSENKRLSHGFHHDKQLEILREQQETIRQERSELEKLKEREQHFIAFDRDEIKTHRDEIEKEKADLKAQKEEIQHQKEVLQRQMDLFEENRRRQLQENAKVLPPGLRERSESPIARGMSPSNRSVSQSSLLEHSHKRSASDDLTRQSPDRTISEQRDGSSRESLNKSRSASSGQQPRWEPGAPNVPMHLLSATNEQKIGQIPQQIPHKLAGLSSTKSSPSSVSSGTVPSSQSKTPPSGLQQMLPYKLSGSQSSSQILQKQGSAGLPNSNSSPRMSGPTAGKNSTLEGTNRGSQRSVTSLGRSSSSVRIPGSASNILPWKLAEKTRPKSASSATTSSSTMSAQASSTDSSSHSQKQSSSNSSANRTREEIYF